ncbi:hypothetical protein TNCV_4393231 [Trichonephila clavipes]|nr:hypothetical protein TNCV_4393231 [Trichonephila clavipes]
MSSEENVAVNDDNVCSIATIMKDEDILEFVQSSKNIFDADSNGENEKSYCSSCTHVIRNEEHHENEAEEKNVTQKTIER